MDGLPSKRKVNPQERSGVCASCGDYFLYIYTMGSPRKHCGPVCRSRNQRNLKAIRERNLPRCAALGCTSPATRVRSSLCEMHYCRMRRNGTLNERTKPAPRLQSHGYVLERTEHPLSVKGAVYQHRRVAYDAVNGECPGCYWCGSTTTWETCHIDHLNGAKADNREENLVVACARCNRVRGAAWPFLMALTDSSLDALMALVKQHR